MPAFDCELVLTDEDEEIRRPHTFLRDIKPGTFVRFENRDWIVIEIHEGEKPAVICRPASKR